MCMNPVSLELSYPLECNLGQFGFLRCALLWRGVMKTCGDLVQCSRKLGYAVGLLGTAAVFLWERLSPGLPFHPAELQFVQQGRCLESVFWLCALAIQNRDTSLSDSSSRMFCQGHSPRTL